MFSYEYCEIFKNTFFIEHLRWLLLNVYEFSKVILLFSRIFGRKIFGSIIQKQNKPWNSSFFDSKRHETFHCVKRVRIRSYSGPYFPAFRHFLRSACLEQAFFQNHKWSIARNYSLIIVYRLIKLIQLMAPYYMFVFISHYRIKT